MSLLVPKYEIINEKVRTTCEIVTDQYYEDLQNLKETLVKLLSIGDVISTFSRSDYFKGKLPLRISNIDNSFIYVGSSFIKVSKYNINITINHHLFIFIEDWYRDE